MIFKYDPASMRESLATNGYAHLRDVLSDEFVAYMKRFYEESTADAEAEARDWHVAGKKRQFVFDFPSEEAAEEFRRGMARLTGMEEDLFTISERHLKVYDAHAEPFPAPHKDRSASQYSIGLPVHVPSGSTVCVFPDLDAGENQEDHAVFMTDDGDEIARIYESDAALMLNEKPGDLVVFLGSARWHERVRGAGTAVLYIKVNDIGVDPLGEDLFAAAR